MLNKNSINPGLPRVRRAFYLLYAAFIFLPIMAGLDKIFHVTNTWGEYLNPFIASPLHLDTEMVLTTVGFIEVAAGIIVALKPRIGSGIVAIWLVAIIVNLITIDLGAMYDIILRDIALCLSAVALFKLSPP